MKEDITLTENSPWVKPRNARTLTVWHWEADELDAEHPVIQIKGPKGKVLGTLNSTTGDLLAFAKEIIETYG